MSIGNKIRTHRLERGFTLKELAEKAEVSYSFVSAVERDLKRPSIPTLKRIADTLNIPLTYLVGESTEGNSGNKIRFIREGRSLSLEDLAENTGMSVEELEQYEKGSQRPSLESLETIADALGVTIRYFLDQTQTNTSIGTRVKKSRESRGLTVTGLADKAGVSPSLISQIEHDQTVPSLDTLEKLAGELGTSICFFLLEQQDIDDLLSSLQPEIIEMLGDPRVQSVLRAVRDFSAGELKFVLNQIQYFKKNRHLLD